MKNIAVLASAAALAGTSAQAATLFNTVDTTTPAVAYSFNNNTNGLDGAAYQFTVASKTTIDQLGANFAGIGVFDFGIWTGDLKPTTQLYSTSLTLADNTENTQYATRTVDTDFTVDAGTYFVTLTARNGSTGSIRAAGAEGFFGARYNDTDWRSTPDRFGFVGSGEEFVATNPGAVPEPAAWALMIAGFGMAGAGLRRRRAAAPTAG